MISDVENILRVCGIGSYLHIGCGRHSLTFDMLKRSMDAYGIDPSEEIVAKNNEKAPGRFFRGSLLNYPFNAETFDTLLIGNELTHFGAHEYSTVLTALLTMTKRNVVLYFPDGNNGRESNRLHWEKLFIEAGFRRHPSGMKVISYAAHENERLSSLTFFERVPADALEKFPLAWLLENRDLHMDMLREAGRRSDGHVSRYVLAAEKIRPGDVVLDAACGLGYGTAVLAACSRGAKFIGVDIDPESVRYAEANFASQDESLSYQASDVTKLSFIPDHSIDTVISFETIEHVESYQDFLVEVKRVLKPDGRFIGSVPNLWCDETGKDPNPFHFHVFDWNKLQAAINQYFIIDERWAQTAGGGFKLWDKKRDMTSIPLGQEYVPDTEWWVFSACANPLSLADVPYTNPFQKEDDAAISDLVAFGKFYENPWLYRVMVQLGERLTDGRILSDFCAQIIIHSKHGSADHGAALCVLAYQLLNASNVSLNEVAVLVQWINVFEKECDQKNLHAYRWLISLYFVAGRLLMAIGNRDEALAAFTTCSQMDPLLFSPLLATKTISSHMYAGLILVGNNKLDEARQHFESGIKVAHRVLQGDWKNIIGSFSNPLPFGMQEAADVLDLGSQCAQALHALNRHTSSPGFFWDKINLKRFGLVEWNKNLERENDALRRQVSQLHNKSMVTS